MKTIDVVKQDHLGREVIRYPGVVLAQDEHSIILEAVFSMGDTPVMEVVLQRGDRFIETFFSDRWYNIFEIFDHTTGDFKAYYCNIGHLAQIGDETVEYRDLALDLVVLPDGRQFVLDEKEFLDLDLAKETKCLARAGLAAVQEVIRGMMERQGG